MNHTSDIAVRIVDFPETLVALLTHRGDPAGIGHSIARFIAWRKATGLSPLASSRTFGIALSKPKAAPDDTFCFGIAGSVLSPVPEDTPFGIVNGCIPAGRCAVLRHHGHHDTLSGAAQFLLCDWLPTSGEQHGDFPLFFQYLSIGQGVDELAWQTEVYLPLKA